MIQTEAVSSSPPVAVVIPAFCAEPHIAGVLRDIPSWVSLVIVVDDASTDGTIAVVEDAASRDSRIHLVRHEVNQGVVGAVLTGYHEAYRLKAGVIVKMDSDGQMDPAFLPALVEPIVRGQADYVKGNRFVHTRELMAMPLSRRIGNLGLSFLTKMASGYWNLFDPTNGYTAIHASLVPLLNETTIAPRYFFESSMLLELSLLRAVVRDVYVPARYGDETSHLSLMQSLGQFPGALLEGFLRRVWIQYFVRDFGLLSLYLVCGLFFVVSGVIFGAAHWLTSYMAGAPAPTGTIMLAVLPIILGTQLLIQAAGLEIQNQPSQCLHREVGIGGVQNNEKAGEPSRPYRAA